MIVIAIVPVIVMVVGLLLWAYKSKPGPIGARIGEWMFVCGLLVTLFALAKQVLRLP